MSLVFLSTFFPITSNLMWSLCLWKKHTFQSSSKKVWHQKKYGFCCTTTKSNKIIFVYIRRRRKKKFQPPETDLSLERQMGSTGWEKRGLSQTTKKSLLSAGLEADHRRNELPSLIVTWPTRRGRGYGLMSSTHKPVMSLLNCKANETLRLVS